MDGTQANIDPTRTGLGIVAGNNANIAGVVHGDVNYYSFYSDSSPRGGSDAVDFDGYRVRTAAALAQWSTLYTLLDVERVVSSVGADLEVIKNSDHTLLEAVRLNRYLVILGGAGSGKSTSLKYLTYKASTWTPGDPPLLNQPCLASIHIDLTRFRLIGNLSPFQCILVLIGEILHSSGSVEPPSLHAIQQVLTSKTLLIALDSLDEVPYGIRSACVSAIEALRERYPQHQFIITSRQYNFRPIGDWNMVALQPLKDDQIQLFLEKRLGSNLSSALISLVRDNALRRQPLFLTYLTTLFEIGALTNVEMVKSRSGLVHSYVEVLLTRDPQPRRPSGKYNASVLSETLTIMARNSQSDGNSVRISAIAGLLTSALKLSLEDASQILDDLLYSGLLAKDSQYVRFSHQTIQAYFESRNLFEDWAKPNHLYIRARSRFNRIMRRSDNQGAAMYVICHGHGHILRRLLVRCSALNPTLLVAWLEDLTFENRESELTLEAIQRLRANLLRSARYSRLPASNKNKLGLTLLGAYLLLMLVGFPLAELPFFFASCTATLTLYLAFVAGLWMARGGPYVQGVLSMCWTLRNDNIRGELVGVAATISRSWLPRPHLRAISSAIANSAIHGDPLSLLRNIPSVEIALQALSRMPDKSCLAILMRFAEFPNIFSEIAIQNMTERAAIFPEEKQPVVTYLHARYNRPNSDWWACEACRKGIKALTSTPPPRLPMSARLRRPTAKALAKRGGRSFAALVIWCLLFVMFFLFMGFPFRQTTVIHHPHRADEFPRTVDHSQGFRESYKKIALAQMWACVLTSLSCSVFVYLDARRIGSKKVYGFPWEGRSPLDWAIVVAVSFYFGFTAYWFLRDRLVANSARPDLDAIEGAI
jgi:hypothetical protein